MLIRERILTMETELPKRDDDTNDIGGLQTQSAQLEAGEITHTNKHSIVLRRSTFVSKQMAVEGPDQVPC